jgi:YidC/Oxa1 family membrane protein insertase
MEGPGRHGRRRFLPAALVVAGLLAAVLLAACAPQFSPDPTPPPSGAVSAQPSAGASAPASGAAEPSPSAGPSASPPASAPPPPAATPLAPAQPGADPLSTLAWLFTPLFWALFNVLVLFDTVTGNIAISIVLLTLVVRLVLVPIYRRQLVSQKQLQLVQPELRELQRRYKGDRQKQMQIQSEFYKERGISPAAGCLPVVLSLFLLLPMYQVISQGLTNYDPSGMSLIPLQCDPAPIIETVNGVPTVTNPCLDPIAFGVDWSIPEVFATIPIPVINFPLGLSILAIISALLQLVQSRMTLPSSRDGKTDDPNVRTQRQMVILLPFISIVYGGLLPAGLFLYWIFSTLFSIGQQYLIIGWGGMFPIMGWDPPFAQNHSPRFPVAMPPPKQPSGDATSSSSRPEPPPRRTEPAATIRPRGRSRRRGRRR